MGSDLLLNLLALVVITILVGLVINSIHNLMTRKGMENSEKDKNVRIIIVCLPVAIMLICFCTIYTIKQNDKRNIDNDTSVSTNTTVPTNTSIIPTNTSIIPTNTSVPTNTSIIPTNTSVPTNTSIIPTSTSVSTNISIIPTSTSVPTNTSIIPANTSVPANISAPTNTLPPINIGDYIQFGKYYGEPILWKCVNKDSNGTMLVSEYILCMKAYDAAENGSHLEGEINYTDMNIQNLGSGKWSNSNIREWLNCTQHKVFYTTQPPTKNAIWSGYAEFGTNSYENEPGFLSNFSLNEQDKIKGVLHEQVEDKVFILSLNEVNTYVGNNDSARIKYLTTSARNNSEMKYTGSNAWWYWTRDSQMPYNVQIINNNGTYSNLGLNFSYSANNGCGGILPALYLNTDTCFSGRGTKDNPYTIVKNRE